MNQNGGNYKKSILGPFSDIFCVLFPESKHRDRQLTMSQQSVFELDALQSSKAITTNVTNPDYDAYFGAIAYQKGTFFLFLHAFFFILHIDVNSKLSLKLSV